MAYTRVTGAQETLKQPGADPGVLNIHLANTDADDYSLYIPWHGCRLAYAYAINHTAIDANADPVITIEDGLNGTAIGTITITKSGAVGAITEMAWSVDKEAAAARGFRLNDVINLAVNGDGTPAGAFEVFLYFEQDYA